MEAGGSLNEAARREQHNTWKEFVCSTFAQQTTTGQTGSHANMARSTYLRLPPAMFARLYRLWGPRSGDGFASTSNALLRRFNAR